MKGYQVLCNFFAPADYECPVISVNGGPFKASPAGIKGLAFAWGRETTLLATVKKTPPDWEDVPPFEYSLIRETGSTPVDSARFEMDLGRRNYVQTDNGVLQISGYDKAIAYTEPLLSFLLTGYPSTPLRLTVEMRAVGGLRLVSARTLP